MSHGKVTVSRIHVERNTTVTITTIPEDGYHLKSLNVTSDSKFVPLTKKEDGKYTFTKLVGTVKVDAVFALDEIPETSWNTPCWCGQGRLLL